MTQIIDDFSGEYDFLSNDYPSRISLSLTSKNYNTVNEAFTALCDHYASLHLPMYRLYDMNDLIMDKFLTYPELAERLIATGEAIIHAPGDDELFCYCNGEGLNKLGIILMGVRDTLYSNFFYEENDYGRGISA